MTDIQTRIADRARAEWPGERVTGDGVEHVFPPVRKGGKTDTIIEHTARIAIEEVGAKSTFDRMQAEVGLGNAKRGFHEEGFGLIAAVADGVIGDEAALRNYWIVKFGLIITEAAEAIEEIRKGRGVDEAYYSGAGDYPESTPVELDGRPRKPEGVPSELADIVIRCLDLAHEIDYAAKTNFKPTGFSLWDAIDEKLRFNATRPYKHGKQV